MISTILCNDINGQIDFSDESSTPASENYWIVDRISSSVQMENPNTEATLSAKHSDTKTAALTFATDSIARLETTFALYSSLGGSCEAFGKDCMQSCTDVRSGSCCHCRDGLRPDQESPKKRIGNDEQAENKIYFQLCLNTKGL
ncbi:hypothetical protein L5515_017351 [Caenorhabditis briggsae]|uniref:Uncharacterized protein n=1 Tax=Caenorhabditis briggsae TaxID=6238 RepID=A0AAE9JRF3_CAEBR|nr:hypothetical protein L5515_017351 [Caenorhabditis briggsae]